MITLILGTMGSGKSYEAVKYVILEALKQGRRVVTNISGLQKDRIAAYLKLEHSEVERLLVVVTPEQETEVIGPPGTVASDTFWANAENSGLIQHGDVLVLDEAWKWLRDGKKLTPKCLEFVRLHRQWVGGPNNTSCDLYLISQRDKDIAPAIRDTAERVLELAPLRRTGLQQAYLRTEKVGVGDRKGQSVRLLRDKSIFPLYSSHKVEGASEALTDNRGVWYRNPLVARAGFAFLLAAAGLAYAGPKVVALVNPAGVKHDLSQSESAAQTSPAAKTSNIVAEGLGAPNQLNGFPQLVPPPNVIPTAEPVEARLSSGIVGGLPPSLGRSSLQPSSAIGRDSGSDRNLEPAPPERVPSFVQVLPLKGDPAAVEAVTKAFCDLNACRVVIRAQTSQVVVVGTNAEVAMLTRILDDLGERPPGLLVQAIILELDESANQALGLSVGGESGRTALDVSQTIGSGSGIALSYNLGGFVATLEALQANGAARVLTAPSVMSWAGEKSSVRASQEVPVLSQIVSENSGSTRQGIEYRDSGILLDLEQITAGPKPIFRANLEVSAFVATETGVKGSPTKSSRTLSTVAELPLGQVLLLGGIERDTSSTTQDRLPVFNVPVSKRSRTSKTRIYVALIATAPTPLASSRALAAEAAR